MKMISSHSTCFFFNTLFDAGNYEVWLTVAAVGMLKTIENDIPVLLEAYTTLKSDGRVYLLIENHNYTIVRRLKK